MENLDAYGYKQPARAKMMVEVAKTQDNEVGDGTTSAAVLSGELLSKAEERALTLYSACGFFISSVSPQALNPKLVSAQCQPLFSTNRSPTSFSRRLFMRRILRLT